MLAKFLGDPKSSWAQPRGCVQEPILELGPEVAAHGIGGNFRGNLVSIFPHLLSGNAVENFRPRWSLGRWLPDGFRGRAAAVTPLVV